MAYSRRNWATGEDFDETAVDAWEGRIESAFAADDARMDGIDSTTADHETRIDDLEAKLPRVPSSPNNPVADSYALQTTDIGCEVHTGVTNTAKTVTLNNITATAGDCIFVSNNGDSVLTFVAGSGVTIRSRGGLLTMTERFAVARLRKVASGIWQLSGELG